MLGKSAWELDKGDIFSPVEYELTAYICREYAHGFEENCEWFFSSESPHRRQIRPPTLVHIDKVRLLRKNCPEGIGPHWRVHYEYHARHHSLGFVGEIFVVSGRVTDRYLKRDRVYVDMEVEVRTSDNRLVTTYADKTLMKYLPEGKAP